jgi:hypothetical protein
MTNQITVSNCKHLVSALQDDGKPFHFYYKRLLGTIEENQKEYVFVGDLSEALDDEGRYGSLFLRTGSESSWDNQYQILSDSTSEPI